MGGDQRIQTVVVTGLLLLSLFVVTGLCLDVVHVKKFPQEVIENPITALKPGFCGVRHNTTRECKQFNHYNLRFFMSLFGIIAWGAFVRTMLRLTRLCIPYTVILMVTGLLIGLGTRIEKSQWENGCEQWSTYTKIARMHPKIILFVFLPVLIFESAFSMNPHVFVRSAAQILIAALPGMLITTFITALVCQNFLIHYKWNFSQASLFGSIISATDPVAVVAILKELGTSESLSTLIEGESLLNDGVAILLYEIFEEIVVSAEKQNLAVTVVAKFCRIALGGPAFGFLMAKIAVFCLSKIFNDATVEITITLVAAYLTYYIGEQVLGVSGVMAVVILGIVMSAERTSITPEVEIHVQHFWEMLAYLANTVLFVLVGIVITETAINSFLPDDGYYLLFLYLSLGVIRLFMLLVLSPFLSRIGYGISWQSMIVMMWGGLRGAVGICLALEVYTNPELCDKPLIGPKFLLQTAGIVFFTLVLNGTTTEQLMDWLKITEISIGRIQDMTNAFKQITGAQSRTIAVLRNDRFLADANWNLVFKYSKIDNPYSKHKPTRKRMEKVESRASQLLPRLSRLSYRSIYSENMHSQKEPNKDEYREMTEEARLRCLKALKVSFWRQYEQGVLTEVAVQILRNAASSAEDKPLRLLRSRDLSKYWILHGVFPWLQIRLTRRFGKLAYAKPPKPHNKFRIYCWKIARSSWFEYTILAIIFLNLVPVAVHTYYLINDRKNFEREPTFGIRNTTFFVVNIFFTTIYLIEAFIKLCGLGLCFYFCGDKWNYLDFVLLLLSLADLIVAILEQVEVIVAFGPLHTIRLVRGLRVLRIFRLLRPLFPLVLRAIDRRINQQLFLGYDIGKGFVTAIDDVIKFLPQMIGHQKILKRLYIALAYERLKTVKEMGMLQKAHPGIAIAVKTRHASRAVLNQMREALVELKEDGLIDDKENAILLGELEQKMKQLWHSPSTIPVSPPDFVLENLPWVIGDDDLLTYVKKHAQLVTFDQGDMISDEGDSPNGIYIIVSGMVKIHYIPNVDILKSFEKHGIVPNMELFLDLTFHNEEIDFFSTATIIGEKSVLTGELRCASVSCETSVMAYHLQQQPMTEALKIFNDPYDSLESRMWRSYGIRLATALLPTQPAYASWTLDKIRMHLERSAVPVGEKFETLSVPEYISDIIVIQGEVVNYHTKEVYRAPSLVPRSCSKFNSVHVHDQHDDVDVIPRVLVVAMEEVDHDEDELSPSKLSLDKVLVKQNNSGSTKKDYDAKSKTNHSHHSDRRGSKQRQNSVPSNRKRVISLNKVQPSSNNGVTTPKQFKGGGILNVQKTVQPLKPSASQRKNTLPP